MRRGIVGGTFDPIHAAHCYLMEECSNLLDLDEVLVIPNGDPPHKEAGVTGAQHRLAMVKRALKDFPGLTISDIEVVDSEVSYTWRTLTHLSEIYPDDELFFIMGADSLAQFQSWRHPEVILKLAHLVCFDRPGYRTAEVHQSAEWIRKEGGHVMMIDSLDLEISSTDIRERVARGLPHRAFLHPDVYDYIHHHKLYESVDE